MKTIKKQNGYDCRSTQTKPEYLKNKTPVRLGSLNSEKEEKVAVSTGKADSQTKPKPLFKARNAVNKYAANGKASRHTNPKQRIKKEEENKLYIYTNPSTHLAKHACT